MKLKTLKFIGVLSHCHQPKAEPLAKHFLLNIKKEQKK
nr:MAG TPA: hypothetical protein [Caudoviricetes sp.]